MPEGLAVSFSELENCVLCTQFFLGSENDDGFAKGTGDGRWSAGADEVGEGDGAVCGDAVELGEEGGEGVG